MLCLTAHPPGAQTCDEHIRQVTIEKVWRKEHAIGKQGWPKKSQTIVEKKQGQKRGHGGLCRIEDIPEGNGKHPHRARGGHGERKDVQDQSQGIQCKPNSSGGPEPWRPSDL